MDESLVFGFKAILVLVVFTVGMALGSLYGAVWLRLAAAWLRMGNVPYLWAFLATFAANLVAFFFNFSIGFNHGLAVNSAGQFGGNVRGRSLDLMYAYTPMYFLLAGVVALVLSAALFSRLLPGPTKETRHTFTDCLGLAALTYSLSFASALFIGLMIYCIVLGLLEVI